MRWSFVKYPWQVALAEVPDMKFPPCIRPGNGSGIVIFNSGEVACKLGEFAGFLKAPVQMLGAWAFVEFPGPSFRSDGLRDLPVRYPGGVQREEVIAYKDAPQRKAGSAPALFHECMTGALQELSAILFDCRRKERNRFLEKVLSDCTDQFVSVADDDRAARALVCDLAQHIVPCVEAIVERPRQVLQRKHALVRMDRLQEMDVASLIDYARRPGRTAAVKAGDRQQLKAVIREETANTLENRVVHDFCSRVMPVARNYLGEECDRCRHRGERKCTDAASDAAGVFSNCCSRRVKAVHNFGQLCAQWLQSEPLSTVTPLRTPCRVPNYALQQNVRYVRIWDAYQRLLRQEDVLEQTWRWKRRAWSDLVRVWAIHAMEYLGEPAFRLTRKPIRIREMPEFGCWLKPEPFDGPMVFETVRGAFVSLYLLNRNDVDRVFQDAGQLSLLNADFYWVAVSTEHDKIRVIPVWAMIGDTRWGSDPLEMRQEWASDLSRAAEAWLRRRGSASGTAELVRLVIIRGVTSENAHQLAATELGCHVTLVETSGRRETFAELTNLLAGMIRGLIV